MYNIFYVYVYLDPRKPGVYGYDDYEFEYEPFYIGKGQNDQSLIHLKKSKVNFNKGNQFKFNKIRKIKKETGKNPIIVKIKENLLENKSFELEMKLIKDIGRINQGTGPLTNLTDGGEGTSGWVPSEKVRRKMGDSRKGEKNPNFGKSMSEEQKKKISKSQKKRHVEKIKNKRRRKYESLMDQS